MRQNMPRKITPENDVILSTGGAAPRRQTANSRAKRAKTTGISSSIENLTPVTAEPSTVTEPSQEEIAALAFSYWEARGCQGGSQEEDWLRAEQQLRARLSRTSAATA
jgi:hypothetical protein